MPKYLCSYLTFHAQENYPLRSVLTNKTNVIPSRTKTFKKTFFPYCIIEWNNLNAEVRNAKSIKFFKKMIVTDNKENSVFSVYDPYGVKLLTRLRPQFSHLKEHKFRHGFGDTVRPMCVDVMLKLKIPNTSSCVVIFILFKDLSSSIILKKLTLLLHN